MFWPVARLRRPRHLEIRQRLEQVRVANPESHAWLRLLEAALAEAERAAVWDRAVPLPAGERAVGAPMLHGCTIHLDRRVLSAWVRRLLALGLDGRTGHRIDPAELLAAGIAEDDDRLNALAGDGEVPAERLRVLAQIAAFPLLQACGRALGGQIAPAWWEGYCPVCGAWPTLSEFRGLERRRWLRCGRCGSGWQIAWLRCAFCGEAAHEQLGYLAAEDSHEGRKVEYCRSCSGYLKGVPTVQPLPGWAILLDDLGSMELDIAALARGYRRPERPARRIEVQVIATRSGRTTSSPAFQRDRS